MKVILVISLLSGLFLTGCGDSGSKSTKATNETASSVITAPVDYLGAIDKGQQHAIKTIDVASINQAIQMFQVSEDRLPKDLDELVTMKYLPSVPKAPRGKKIVYDANTGTIKIVAE
jgi:PBP1b-binding outer membrane lipoprotein LpoB